MKAAQLTAYGGADSLQTNNDVSKPTPAADEVLVAVKAAATNPFDYKLREGYMKDFIKLQLPATLGSDVAGTVAAVGDEVNDFEVGQAVYGMAGATSGQGSYAEFTVVKASQLASKPISIDFQTAAALPLAAISAYQALVDHMNLQAGQKILIHGGAGGIGSLAIQIAKDLGAHVATTASAGDAEFVKQLGADEVIDYTSQDFATIVKDYDAVFDTIGGESNAKSYDVLRTGGALVSMVEEADEAKVKERGIVYTHQFTKPTQARLQAITQLVDSGKLHVNIDKVFSLDQAGEALEYLKTGHPKGKVVIQVAE